VPFYLVLAGAAVGWRGCVRDASVFAANPTATPEILPVAPSIALGLALGLAIVGLSQLWTKLWPSGEAVARMLGESIGELRLRDCALLALVSGFAEEMFFRGALQPELGLVAASVVFGLAHLVPRWPLVLWSLFAVAIGFVFGWVFDWTGSLWAPAIAHVVVNGVNLPILSRRYGRGATLS
jgi:membrane protease YdiL (CAAX protease family)